MYSARLWKKVDRFILGIVLALIGFGLVAVSSASAVLSFNRFGNNNYYFFRQLLFAALGIFAIYFFSRIDYHLWKKWSFWILLAGFLALALVLLPKVGFRVGSSRSWFSLGSFLVQPSEFVKLAVILYLASWFDRKRSAETNFLFGIMPPLLISGLTVLLIVIEPDIGTAVMLSIIIFCVLFGAGAKWQYLAGLGSVGIALLWILIKAAPYRAERIITFLDPSLDPLGIGYHINQALLAIGSGGFWGRGFGESIQKHNYLPEPIGDSIFAVMAEEFGFIRIIILLIMFLSLAIASLKLSRQAPDKFSALTIIGITSWITMQTLINIGAITRMLPLTGITLPFISYGGSSLLSLCVAVGIMLNISRQRG